MCRPTSTRYKHNIPSTYHHSVVRRAQRTQGDTIIISRKTLCCQVVVLDNEQNHGTDAVLDTAVAVRFYARDMACSM